MPSSIFEFLCFVNLYVSVYVEIIKMIEMLTCRNIPKLYERQESI